MTPYDEIAKGAFLTLVGYCLRQARNRNGGCVCDGCIFFTEEVGCIFGSGELPSMWELPEKK